MIGVYAAHRIRVMANADETLARKYLKEVAGIDVGKLYNSSPSQLTFEIDQNQFRQAKQKLSQKFKWEPSKIYNSQGGSVAIDDTGKRRIGLDLYMKLGPRYHNQPWISLTDLDHSESMRDMIKRIIGPTKPINVRQ